MLLRFRDRVRFFNKHFTNRILGRFTLLAHGPFAMVFHRGRKSGKSYQTPIVVTQHAGDFLIALTYGPHVDWYLNIRNAGKCSLRWHNHRYEIRAIEPADSEEAMRFLPGFERLMLGLVGVRDFAWLRVAA